LPGGLRNVSLIRSAVTRKRIDHILTERGFFESRRQAQLALRSGRVLVEGQPVTKPGKLYETDLRIRVRDKPRYVSRGGYKLKGALDYLKLKVKGKVALDVGSSTGGFTDCLLQEGVRRVYSLDVGKGQLAWKLRQDPRVVVREKFNVRYLTPADLPEKVDLITVDVSFISLTKVLPALGPVLKKGGLVLALIKPQFEAGRSEIRRGGVVRDPAVHRRVIEKIRLCLNQTGMAVKQVTESVLTGPAGNKEFFIFAGR
jgi:23S rRNA (cytidine1920-2'-O)/16S rRNA (cytidine1409-2'-O)-methyltransferase